MKCAVAAGNSNIASAVTTLNASSIFVLIAVHGDAAEDCICIRVNRGNVGATSVERVHHFVVSLCVCAIQQKRVVLLRFVRFKQQINNNNNNVTIPVELVVIQQYFCQLAPNCFIYYLVVD